MNRIDRIKLAIDKGITCNPETGEVFGVKGNVISTKDKKGRILIGIRGEGGRRIEIKAHQFIWYWVNSEIVDRIDHINRNPSDNRISNLRLLTNSENIANNGAKGYYYWKSRNKYVAQIMINYKKIHLGVFDNEYEAKKAYIEAKKIHFPKIV